MKQPALVLITLALFGFGFGTRQAVRADDPPVAKLNANANAEIQSRALTLTDMSDYLAALEPVTATTAIPEPVSFRDLWEHPETYQGRIVTVTGRVARRFRQPARGDFPPLAEIWAFTPEGNPWCLVFPWTETSSTHTSDTEISTDQGIPETGTPITFTGTFLRLIRYAAGDQERIAPLIVGPEPPQRNTAETSEFQPFWGNWKPRTDLLIAVILGVLAAAILGFQHAKRRRPNQRGPASDIGFSQDPEPVFVDRIDPEPPVT